MSGASPILMKTKHPTRIEPLEARIAPATITLVAGVLTFTDVTGLVNNITLNVSGANYQIIDTGEVITLGAGTAGFTGGGTNTVLAPDASVTSLVFDLSTGSDLLAIGNGTFDPTTVNGGPGINDRVNFTGTPFFNDTSSFTADAINVIGSLGGTDLTLTTDAIDIAGPLGAVSGLVIQTQTNTRAITLGTEVAGTLSLTDAELDLITTNAISNNVPVEITSFGSAAINVTAPITNGNFSILVLTSGGALTESGTGSISNVFLTAAAGGGITLDGPNNVPSLISGGSGSLSFSNGSNALTLKNPVQVAGTNLDIAITAGSLTLQGAVTNVSGGDITLTTDSMDIQAGATINAGGGAVNLQAKTAFRGVNLGTATGGLDLTDAELDRVTAGTLAIGGSFADDINVSSAINPANSSTLVLSTLNGGITGAGTIAVAKLALRSGNAISLTGANDVDNLAALVGGIAAIDTFSFTDSDGLVIDSVGGLSGIKTSQGTSLVTTTLTAGGAVTQAVGADLIGRNLVLAGAGPFTLNNPTNQMLGIQGTVTNAISYTDANDLQVNSLDVPLATTNSAITLHTVNGDLTVKGTGVIKAGISSVTLSADGATTAIVVDAGAQILTTGPNSVVTLSADVLTLNGTINTGTATGKVRLQPVSTGRLIDLGGAGGATKLGISSAEVNLVTTAELIVGRTGVASGDLSITAQIQPTGTGFLSLESHDSIIDGRSAAGADLIAATINFNAGGAVGSVANPIEIQAATVGAVANGGDIGLSAVGSVAIGSATLLGLSTFNGDISFNASGSISLARSAGFSISAGGSGGDVTLVSTGNSSDVKSTVNADAIKSAGGGISVTAGRDILLGTAGAGFDNDVQAEGSITLTGGRDVTIAGSSSVIADFSGSDSGGTVQVNTGAGGTFTLSATGSGNDLATGGSATNFGEGDVTIRADRFVISGGATIVLGQSNFFFLPFTNGRSIDLGSTTDAAATVEISSAELSAITAAQIRLDTFGDITFTAAIAPGAASNLVLASTGSIGNSFVGTAFTGSKLTIALGNLKPGGDNFGIFAVAGDFAFQAASSFAPNIGGTVPGTDLDQLKVTGTVNLGGADLFFALGTIPGAGNVSVVIDNDAADAIVGNFAELSEGEVIEILGTFVEFSYAGGSGNDLVATAVVPVDPTFSLDFKTATYTDEDGDTVTVKTTKGKFDKTNFVFRPVLGVQQQLRTLDLNATAVDFTGANITISAKPSAAGGNSFANVGFIAGAGEALGNVKVGGDLGKITAASLNGLTVQSFGALGTITQVSSVDLNSLITGKLGKLTVKSDARDINLQVNDQLGTVTVGGDFIRASLKTTLGLGPVTITGNVVGGQISAGNVLGAVTVKGSIIGTTANPVVISGFGKGTAPATGRDVAITSLKVTGGVESLRLLAGYDVNQVGANADASIGAITVGTDWHASTVLAGVETGLDRAAGTDDDRAILGAGVRNNVAISSRIASVTIKGQALGTAGSTTDAFGIVAEQIGSAKVGTRTFAFKADTAAANQREGFFAAPTGVGSTGLNSDFIFREVGSVTANVALTIGLDTSKGNIATFTDVDGDLVTVKTTVGTFSDGDFTIVAAAGGGGQLRLINLDDDGAEFTNAKLTITAKPGPLGGNGFVNIGEIRADGVDLGNVSIAGDLGQLDAANIKDLTVQSLGGLGTGTQGAGGILDIHSGDDFGKLTVKSDLRGTTMFVNGTLKSVSVLGSIFDGEIATGGGMGAVTVKGSIFGGVIQSGRELGAVSVTGSIVGNAFDKVVISAFGKSIEPTTGIDLAIKSLTVGGGVEFLRLLAGYDVREVAKNSDASIGAITVGGDWRASTVLAGVEKGGDRADGSADDQTIVGGSRNNAAIFSQIASITIKGQGFGTAGPFNDSFGIVAEQIGSAKIGAAKFKFTAGKRSPADVFLAAPTGVGAGGAVSDFIIRESVL